MKRKVKNYLNYHYPVRIIREPDGMYCAEVDEVKGLCAYGNTPVEALNELEGVKEAAFGLMLSQGQAPPVPKVKLEIPENVFRRISNKRVLKQYVKA